MKKITIFLILILFGCSKNDCTNNEKIRKIETDKIVETLFQQKYIENYKNSYTFCISLRKLKINTESLYTDSTKKIKTVKLPRIGPKIFENAEIYIENLLEVNLNGKKFFNLNDSINFVKQNNCFLEYTLPKTVSRKVKTISVFQAEKDENFIILSVPIFSEDNKKVYIKIDYYPKRYQYGTSLYLAKIDSVWKVISSKDYYGTY
ncbi:hypothetical protein [Flavobacterium sp. HBTb2-11-1]|uniref:hypothetical protein n=1 Tax=Flavobacterium sp. HBTb2-11-1 TaxID=2692212 RepID=UPI00136E424D|nr:hypothetical protein [Flavobacterium sp. HBTb2-11-1]MXO05744.1 hypothetical protein [Flavobacterium sp. HBTb2-11-1]